MDKVPNSTLDEDQSEPMDTNSDSLVENLTTAEQDEVPVTLHTTTFPTDDEKNITVAETQPEKTSEQNTNPLEPFFLNQWLDIKDTQNCWLEAQVIQPPDMKRNIIRVHYKGWKAKYGNNSLMNLSYMHNIFDNVLHFFFSVICVLI